MATENAAAKDERASDFAADFAAATLTIRDATTTLAVHTLAGFGAPASGLVSANAIADVTNANSGTADNAVLTAGTLSYTLTVSGVGGGGDLELDDLNYVQDGTSKINTFAVQF